MARPPSKIEIWLCYLNELLWRHPSVTYTVPMRLSNSLFPSAVSITEKTMESQKLQQSDATFVPHKTILMRSMMCPQSYPSRSEMHQDAAFSVWSKAAKLDITIAFVTPNLTSAHPNQGLLSAPLAGSYVQTTLIATRNYGTHMQISRCSPRDSPANDCRKNPRKKEPKWRRRSRNRLGERKHVCTRELASGSSERRKVRNLLAGIVDEIVPWRLCWLALGELGQEGREPRDKGREERTATGEGENFLRERI